MDATIVCYIKENSWLARLAAWRMKSPHMALVVGRTVHLYGVTTKVFMQSTGWVRHEACHIRQYQQYGTFPFLIRYFREWIRYGYYQISFEREARAAEKDPHITDGMKWMGKGL